MSAIDRVLEANQKVAIHYDPKKVSPYPQIRLSVLSCMDTRISMHGLGLKEGDAHMIRNAGGIATEDAIRSLVVSHYLLGTVEVMVINHTDCGLMKASEDELRHKIEQESGKPATHDAKFHAFHDVNANVRAQVEKLKAHPWLKGRVKVRGFVFEVETGRLREVPS